MSLADQASLLLIPSGYKSQKLYSIFPTNGVGDFDFSRSGSATRIAQNGLITTVDSNVPRLNYPMIDGKVVGCPHHILEPQRTNLVTYSEDFSNSYWTKSGVSETSGFISPDGTANAFKLVEDTSSGNHKILPTSTISGVAGSYYSFSVYVKKKGSTRHIYWMCQRSGDAIYAHFDMNSYSVSQVASAGTGSNASASITSVGNDWYRISLSGIVSTIASLTFYNQFYLSDTVGSGFTPQSYTGDGTSGFYLWGWQVEQGSYPTSYIPTSGSATTRSAETANNSGDASTFNSSEGVLMVEVSALADDNTDRKIGIVQGSTQNQVSIGYSISTKKIRAITYDGAVKGETFTNVYDVLSSNKVAYKYKSGDNVLWVNGFALDTSTNTNILDGVTLNSLNFNASNSDFYGNTKQIQYYNSALTDSELEQLTSWTSFTDMANGQLYTIE